MKMGKIGTAAAIAALCVFAATGCGQSGPPAAGSGTAATAGGGTAATADGGTTATTGGGTAATAGQQASSDGGGTQPADSGGQQPAPSGNAGTATAPGSGGAAQPAQTPGAASGSGKAPTASPSAQASMGTATAVRLIDAESGWVGGDSWIARTDDGGKQWNVQQQTDQPVRQLFALDGKQAWAVLGTAAADSKMSPLLRTTDGGSHWESYGSVPGGAFLHFVSAQEAFAGNNRTTDGGKSWTSLHVPDGVVGSAYFHDKDHGWAVTKSDGTFYVQKTTDGGKTWQKVMNRSVVSPLTNVVIRSAGVNDAWVECIGDSGMSQTSYSLFHTSDGGANWQTVIAKSTAGGGPAPGFPMNYSDGPDNGGSKPGDLYVVDPNTAFMGGYCPACDNANTIGWTKDGGKTWTKGDAQFPGFAGGLLAFADGNRGWWICTDNAEPSVMYVTTDGGKSWQKAHTFDKPKAS